IKHPFPTAGTLVRIEHWTGSAGCTGWFCCDLVPFILLILSKRRWREVPVLPDGVFEGADRIDRNRHNVALLQVFRRVEPYAHPRAGAGGDKVGGLQGHYARQGLD